MQLEPLRLCHQQRATCFTQLAPSAPLRLNGRRGGNLLLLLARELKWQREGVLELGYGLVLLAISWVDDAKVTTRAVCSHLEANLPACRKG